MSDDGVSRVALRAVEEELLVEVLSGGNMEELMRDSLTAAQSQSTMSNWIRENSRVCRRAD